MSGSEVRIDRQLERYVASLYHALGFHVESDVNVQGNQVDVMATRHVPGIGDMRILIEVKHRSQAVRKTEVVSFASLVTLLLGAQVIDRAIMVADNTFSKASREFIENQANIELITLAELERQVVSAEQALTDLVARYRQAPINDLYVDLTFNLDPGTNAGGVVLAHEADARKLLDLALEHPTYAWVITADYGAGKTTSLERIEYEAAQQKVTSPGDALTPLLIPLKTYSEYPNVGEFVCAVHRSKLRADVDPETFSRLLNDGRYLILLDGFDEITTRATAGNRSQYLKELAQLLFSPSPAILTTRPSYFVSTQEMREALRFAADAYSLQIGTPHPGLAVPGGNPAKRLYDSLRPQFLPTLPSHGAATYVGYNVCPLSDRQINSFLKKFEPQFKRVGIESSELVRSFIDGIYDLSDLMTRPIILEMIAKTILGGHLKIDDPEAMRMGPADLYETYTALSLDIDQGKGTSRHGLSLEDRRRFAQVCADYMHDAGGELEVPPNAIAALVRRARITDAEDLITDLRTCSFLTVTDDGRLRFVHKSFQEFFLARAIVEEMSAHRGKELRRTLPTEVLYFVGALAFSNGDFYSRLNSLLNPSVVTNITSPSPSRRNAATSLLYSSSSLENLQWEDVDAGPVRRRTIDLRQSKFDRVGVESIETNSLTLTDCRCQDLLLDGYRIGALSLVNCGGAVRVRGRVDCLRVSRGAVALDDQSTAEEVTLEELADLSASVRVARRDRKVVDVTAGGCALSLICEAHLRLMSQSSWLRLSSKRGFTINGEASHSLVQIDHEAIDNVTLSFERCGVVVVTGPKAAVSRHAQRQEELEGTAYHDVDVTLSLRRSHLTECVLITNSHVGLDLGPKRDVSNVYFGADLGGPLEGLRGVFFRRERDLGSDPSGWVRPDRPDKHTLVVAGQGAAFEAISVQYDRQVLALGADPSLLTFGKGLSRLLLPLFKDASGVVKELLADHPESLPHPELG